MKMQLSSASQALETQNSLGNRNENANVEYQPRAGKAENDHPKGAMVTKMGFGRLFPRSFKKNDLEKVRECHENELDEF